MNQTITDIEQKRYDWCVDALKCGFDDIVYGICHKCGKRMPGINSILNMSFTCLMCRAEEIFPDQSKPKEPLDVDDFAKL